MMSEYIYGCRECAHEVGVPMSSTAGLCPHHTDELLASMPEMIAGDIQVCEKHYWLQWTHDDCPGPGMRLGAVQGVAARLTEATVLLDDVVNLAESAMVAANRDGAEYDIDAELTEAVIFLIQVQS